jgi:cyclopropane-fatty-acyl-phospholipid synthase
VASGSRAALKWAPVTTPIETALRQVGERTSIPFAARFAGGGEYHSREARPEFTLVFRKTRAYSRIAALGHVGLLEAYFDGEIDIEGSVAKCMAAGMEAGMDQPKPMVALLNWWHEFLYSNSSWIRSRSNAEFHYAHNPEFYRLWLDDPLMLYTCAYWNEGTRTLEEAQRAKLDHVARKLLLKPGEDVLDIGSGFGGFIFHAHERYGTKVTGYNPTRPQVEMVRREIERKRIGHSVRVADDYRDIDREFDKLASIGSLEHAGRDHLAEVIRRHARFLKPGGLGLIHFIGHVGRFETDYFIRKYVFPGGWIPSLADTIVEMERAGLEVLDIENLRRHYALTLDVWAERFDRNWERIHALDPKNFDERFRRIWRVYLYGCAERFRSPAGKLHLFQIVFSKGNTTTYPMSRGFLYEPPAAYPEKRSAGRAA